MEKNIEKFYQEEFDGLRDEFGIHFKDCPEELKFLEAWIEEHDEKLMRFLNGEPNPVFCPCGSEIGEAEEILFGGVCKDCK